MLIISKKNSNNEVSKIEVTAIVKIVENFNGKIREIIQKRMIYYQEYPAKCR
jgi:hypothetical protein